MDYYLNCPSCIKEGKKSVTIMVVSPNIRVAFQFTHTHVQSFKMEHVNMHRQSSDLMTIPSHDITFQFLKFHFFKHTHQSYHFVQSNIIDFPITYKIVQILIFGLFTKVTHHISINQSYVTVLYLHIA